MGRRRRLGLLASGKLFTTEKATVYIDRGCAIIERHGGGLPGSVSGPIRAAIDGLTDGGRPR
jgi:hypothetical protein